MRHTRHTSLLGPHRKSVRGAPASNASQVPYPPVRFRFTQGDECVRIVARIFLSRSLASLVIGLLCFCVGYLLADDAEIKSALTLRASFDNGVDADFSKGDKKLYTWIDRKKNVAKAGLHTEGKSGVGKREGNGLETVLEMKRE